MQSDIVTLRPSRPLVADAVLVAQAMSLFAGSWGRDEPSSLVHDVGDEVVAVVQKKTGRVRVRVPLTSVVLLDHTPGSLWVVVSWSGPRLRLTFATDALALRWHGAAVGWVSFQRCIPRRDLSPESPAPQPAAVAVASAAAEVYELAAFGFRRTITRHWEEVHVRLSKQALVVYRTDDPAAAPVGYIARSSITSASMAGREGALNVVVVKLAQGPERHLGFTQDALAEDCVARLHLHHVPDAWRTGNWQRVRTIGRAGAAAVTLPTTASGGEEEADLYRPEPDEEGVQSSFTATMEMPVCDVALDYAESQVDADAVVPVVVDEAGRVQLLEQVRSCLSSFDSSDLAAASPASPRTATEAEDVRDLKVAFEELFAELMDADGEEAPGAMADRMESRLRAATTANGAPPPAPAVLQAAIVGALQSHVASERTDTEGVRTAMMLRQRIDNISSARRRQTPLSPRRANGTRVRPPPPPKLAPAPPPLRSNHEEHQRRHEEEEEGNAEKGGERDEAQPHKSRSSTASVSQPRVAPRPPPRSSTIGAADRSSRDDSARRDSGGAMARPQRVAPSPVALTRAASTDAMPAPAYAAPIARSPRQPRATGAAAVSSPLVRSASTGDFCEPPSSPAPRVAGEHHSAHARTDSGGLSSGTSSRNSPARTGPRHAAPRAPATPPPK